eukprot:TRINITY_DN18736_c0_g1_i1.p1 TRINITY_DN18736_c0_g1~~TRINITY_DN18736_c0_g1_i1.p1  ORF type:complete len:528 (+),score=130.06 TRINITY_DN18736_c0_g1_i1:94-1677(+)
MRQHPHVLRPGRQPGKGHVASAVAGVPPPQLRRPGQLKQTTSKQSEHRVQDSSLENHMHGILMPHPAESGEQDLMAKLLSEYWKTVKEEASTAQNQAEHSCQTQRAASQMKQVHLPIPTRSAGKQNDVPISGHQLQQPQPKQKPRQPSGFGLCINKREGITQLVEDLDKLMEDKTKYAAIHPKIEGCIWELACHQEGSRLLQKLIELNCSSLAEEQVAALNTLKHQVIPAGLKNKVLEVMRKESGSGDYANYVFQCIIREFPREKFMFIIEELKGFMVEASKHVIGCRIVQRILEHVGEVDEITKQLLEEILSSITELAMHKYGTLVVQTWLRYGSDEQKAMILKALKHAFQRDDGTLSQMVVSPYATWVIEAALDVADRDEYGNWILERVTQEMEKSMDKGDGNPGKKQKKQFSASFVERFIKRQRLKERVPSSKDCSPTSSAAASCIEPRSQCSEAFMASPAPPPGTWQGPRLQDSFGGYQKTLQAPLQLIVCNIAQLPLPGNSSWSFMMSSGHPFPSWSASPQI